MEPGEHRFQAPSWLPGFLVDLWDVLAVYQSLLALIIVVAGSMLAVLGRMLVLFWARKLTARSSRVHGGPGFRLLKIATSAGAWVLTILSLVLAVRVLAFSDSVETLVLRLLTSVLILRLVKEGLQASHASLEIFGRFRNRFPIVEERTMPLFDLMMTVLIVAAAGYALLVVWKVDPTAWLASAGVVGIAVGFAARETLANLFAGFFIIADAPYKVGDYVVLDSGDRGRVAKVGIRSTRMITRDDVEITVPNSEMANTKIYNESGGPWVRFRIRLQVNVAYGSNAEEVVELLNDLATTHQTVCDTPTPRVRLRALGDSGLEFELLCWVTEPSLRGKVTHELYMAIYRALNEAGIEIPFPQRDVWLREAKPR
ncbi:small-conductance mechanosensitive channel [Halomonas fontilapidosi]|uniref:Small-conductance mechanosensitive channel n=1 Tax=Halomonas fontilapidosi TaxID=616675 RepID=A0A7W5GZF4_9GAMM|nr:mechanosensitive ion channel family protein [Halomonas fontilapidosi]MBB3184232.1 small-conductance mechanosensitive channel [Halomonas fontilapidosi]